MYQKPTVPRSIGGVLDDTLQLFKASFSRCVVPALLMGVAVTLVGIYQASQLPLNASSVANLQALLARNSAASPLSGLFSFLAIFIDLVFYTILIYIVSGVSRGQSPSGGEYWAASLRRLPANIGASVLMFIIAAIALGVAFVPAIIAIAGNVAGATPAQVITRVGPAILICLVLCMPVIYILLRMMLYMVPLVADSQGPIRSIATSWRLIGGNWWRTSTLVFVMAVIIYVLTIVVLALAGGVGALVTGLPKNPGQILGAVAIVGAIVGGAIRVVSAPLMAALWVSVYQDLLLRKGGSDLEARLGALPKG